MANQKPHDEDADLRALAIHQYWLRSNKLPTKDISSDSKLSKISFLASKSSNLYDLLKGETASIRERVLAMVEVRGVHLPKISSTGDAVFFIQDTDGNEKVVENFVTHDIILNQDAKVYIFKNKVEFSSQAD